MVTTTNVPRSDQRTSTPPPRTDGGSSGQAASTAQIRCTVPPALGNRRSGAAAGTLSPDIGWQSWRWLPYAVPHFALGGPRVVAAGEAVSKRMAARRSRS
jgi:hypothetical protein